MKAIVAFLVVAICPAVQAATSAAPEAIEAALDAVFPGAIASVAIAEERVTVSGRVEGERSGLALAEIPIDRLLDDPTRFETLDPVAIGEDGRFTIVLPRFRDRSGRRHDRLASRWQLVRSGSAGVAAESHARHADVVPCRAADIPAAVPGSKKGLGGWFVGRLPGELEDLGIGSVTINVVLHRFVTLEAEPGTVPCSWQGWAFHVREREIGHLDEAFRRAADRGAVVSAIVLVGNPAREPNPVLQRLAHPDASREGIFAMPNVISAEGIALYGGLLNFMAERWSRPDGKYGRVHHWIMHNEVDAGFEWTNCGRQPAIVYMDLLQRSLRLMHLVARQYDPHARAFISLTHHWASPGKPEWYGSKAMIDLLARFCHAEGDFPWGVAFHAYPQSLQHPNTWDDHQATFTFDTAKITPRNLEVLEAYLRQPHLLCEGTPRPIHCSENGFNSPEYSDAAFAEQAAGMAYAWKKIQTLPLVEVWHYHNWLDNRHEGGLRIGLRRFPDDPADPGGKKPIWNLYQALGTPREDEACASSLRVIGITSWDEVRRHEPIRSSAHGPQ